MSKKSNRNPLLFIILSAALLPACSGQKQEAGNPVPVQELPPSQQTEKAPETEKAEPVMLYVSGGRYVNTEGFMKTYGDYIQKKYPHIRFTVYDNKWVKDLVATGSQIDIFYSDPVAFPRDLMQFGLEYDMTELIKANNFDLNRLYPGPIQEIQATFDSKITGLPLNMRNVVLNYNKDLFDKFGVAPPKDDMTWDEAYELARKMTRSDGGVQYRGFEYSSHLINYNQLSISEVDPKTERSTVNSDQRWAELVRNFVRFHEIPGNQKPVVGPADHFDKGETAMYGSTPIIASPTIPFALDYAKLPSFPSKPGVGSQSPATYIGLTSTTKHHKEAFKVIEYLLSEEFQTIHTRQGNISSLKSSQVNERFGADVQELAGKNLKAIIPSNPAAPSANKWTGQTSATLWTTLTKVLHGEMDINSGLRLIDEEVNKKIDEIKAASGK